MTQYPKIAWTSMITPTDDEHYQKLFKAGVRDLIVCLHISGFKNYRAGEYHTVLGQRAGFHTHPSLETDLSSPTHDIVNFMKAFKRSGYTENSKVTIRLLSNSEVKDKRRQLQLLVNYMSCLVSESNIGIAIDKKDLDSGEFKLEEIPTSMNLTSFNEGKLNSGVDRAASWFYTEEFDGKIQPIGYDFYGFYSGENKYQLSLNNTYIAQPGDTWVIIATRHGIWLPKLLKLNGAKYEDLVIPGQEIKLA